MHLIPIIFSGTPYNMPLYFFAQYATLFIFIANF